ncbi:MAG TPA: UDP-glucose 4-epimerase GalE [Vicinamibacterales bacterium]|nr:UDP-glucose 4-epimerase GalE [Acidobacteriota bacterium]HOC17584.1 UDP-glucose 4-epimerase GalE [Vicinamibacterales bacterium]
MASRTTASGARGSAVLVTGGAGYIGSHAVKALCEAGRRVVVYDDLSEGHRAAVPGVDLVEGDTGDLSRLREAIATRGVTAVMHFAAWTAVGESVAEPAGYYRNNVGGTLAVLEAMAREKVRVFIFSSTAAVFGEPEQVPIDEHHPARPINPYGETKLVVERALPHYERAYGIRSVCLRYFNAAGADPAGTLGEDHHPERHLIPLALRAATGGTPLQVFGSDYPTPDGTCLRDYVHVTDLAQAHLLALDGLEAGSPSTVYNLGNGRPYSVREVIAAVERVTGRPVPYALGPRRPGDPAVLYASSARIKAELGWKPRYEELDTIVRTAWAWLEAHPNGYREVRA